MPYERHRRGAHQRASRSDVRSPPRESAPSQTSQTSTPAAASAAAAAAAKAAAAAEAAEDVEKQRCHLHKKPNNSCKFCQRYLAAKQRLENGTRQLADADASSKKRIFNCSPMLKEQVLKSSYYKSLVSITSIEDLATEIMQYASDTMDVYRCPLEPSCFMCTVYRLFTLSHTEEELRIITDNPESSLVRCVGFLFIRFVVPPEQLWEKLEEFLLDDAKLVLKDGMVTTIGEFIESLLLKEKYFNTPLPRIPAAVRRKLEERLAPLGQYRKRTKASKRLFTENPEEATNLPVEACIDGQWHQGRVREVVSRIPSRIKARIELDGGGGEAIVHIGQVVLLGNARSTTERRDSRSRSRSRGRRSRSRSRGRGNSPDWSRWKGKSDAAMIEELRERAREDAVCANRKDYAKRPPRFDAGLAIKRDHGCAEARMIEEETYTAPERRRAPTQEEEEERERAKRRRSEEEHERQRKLKDIYDKYSKNITGGGSGSTKDVEGPDKMRLG